MRITDIATLQAHAADYPAVPVWAVIPGEAREPIEAFKVFKRLSRQAYILESMEDTGRRGRYTFIGYDPKLCVDCKDGVLNIKNGTTLRVETGDPGAYIRQILEENRTPRMEGLPPFTGGLVGYFSYDYIGYSEPGLGEVIRRDEDLEDFKDVDLMLFDKVVAYDHLERNVYLIVNIRTDYLEENYNRAVTELEQMGRLFERGELAEMPPLVLTSEMRLLFEKERYCAMVERARAYIKEGDIFQVVLSNRLDADAEGSLFDAYRMLRRINPSPYMFYFSSDDLEIAGASPETLVKVKDGEAFTYPLAGTKPRGATPEEDRAMEEELLADPKERAEHNMLVDLGRNDIGKISEFGSVVVEKYMEIERYSHVMHIGSTVQGRLRGDKTVTDAVDAVLPAGTLSGAPKIRACEIIAELEGNRRGVYGGAIGYLGFSGDMDTCIAIRIAYKKNGRVFVRAGAGIVYDSVPETEFEECRNKAAAVVNALHQAAQEAAFMYRGRD
ncbi:MAG: anthranilate synthase component I family protein [Clostridiales Family XIII bacterium]|jgi:anthranilate synthase component 1|nr:anthranilate synthase component I family protein [Clostridiales Family XIII bacterium]